MSKPAPGSAEPLVERVDALLRRHHEGAHAEADIPVLTEVIDETLEAPGGGLDPASLEALAGRIERAILQQLQPEIERMLNGARAELNAALTQIVREAVAASITDYAARQDPQD